MDPAHVIVKVVAAGKAVARLGTFAVCVEAKIWLGSVTVHAMSLTLVSQKTGSGGKLDLVTSRVLAAERLQVRINVFAVFC